MNSFYGPDPFYWTWVQKFNMFYSEENRFCYNRGMAKHFKFFYDVSASSRSSGDEAEAVETEETRRAQQDEGAFRFENTTFVYFPASHPVGPDVRGDRYLPVLGEQIAYPLECKVAIEKHVSRMKISVRAKESKVGAWNDRIMEIWTGKKLTSVNVKCLCLFHADHKPSAIYYVRSKMFRCYVCQKVFRDLRLQLETANHEILNELAL